MHPIMFHFNECMTLVVMRLKFINRILWKGIDIGFAIKYANLVSVVSNYFIQCGSDTLCLLM